MVAHVRERGMAALREAAAQRPYRKAARHALDKSKADGRLLVEMTRESSVLNVGCGLGVISLAFAQVAGRVIAADPTLECALFVQARSTAEGVTNVVPLHAGVFDLPFDGPTFDVVVLNGVLEWVPVSVQDGRPREVQLRALRTLGSLLEREGQLYVAIENRTGCQFLVGAQDHGGTHFTSLLPRWGASVVTMLRHGRSYRAYTYTYPGYVSLFREAALRVERAYAAFPDHRRLRRVCEVRDIWRVRGALGEHCSRVERALVEAGAALGRPWLFVPAFIFVLKRETKGAAGA